MFTKKNRYALMLGVVVLFAFSGATLADAVSAPLQPAIMRNVANVQDNQFKNPYMPPLRVSGDGRIGISQSHIGGGFYQIFLMKPENIVSQSKNFMQLPVGTPPLVLANQYDKHIVIDEAGDVHRASVSEIMGNPAYAISTRPVDGQAYVQIHNIGGAGSGGMAAMCEENFIEDGGHATVFTRNPYACTAAIVEDGTKITTTITDGGPNDCYDVNVINYSVSYENLNGPNEDDAICAAAAASRTLDMPATCTTRQVIHSRKLTVSVANPKSANAYIAAITMPDTIKNSTDNTPSGAPGAKGFIGAPHFLEPVITRDGRLMVFRIGAGLLPVNPDTGTTGDAAFCESISEAGRIPTDTELQRCRPIDVTYSYNPPGSGYGACDVRGWTTVHPISHAYHDEQLNPVKATFSEAPYGFAEYPIRTPDGEVVPDNRDVRGSYPWMDSKGANLVLSVGGSQLYDHQTITLNRWNRTPSESSCIVPGCPLDHPAGAQNMGNSTFGSDWSTVVAGSWTHGKMVFMDALINNIDFGLQAADMDQMKIQLYQDASGDPVEVRLGVGRVSQVAYQNDYWPMSGVTNSDLFDSLENRWNHQAAFKPASFRDVVWKMQNGKTTDEFAFDDYISPDAYIVSEMVGAYINSGDFSFSKYWWVYPNGESRDGMRIVQDYYDGWSGGVLDAERTRVQNGATTPESIFKVPAYGQAKDYGAASTPRIEPVALGGVKGRGFWLDPKAGLEYAKQYDSPPNPLTAKNEWFVSVFLDQQLPDANYKRLVTFSDGSHISVKRSTASGSKLAKIGFFELSASTPFKEIDISTVLDTEIAKRERWVHLGFQMQKIGDPVTATTVDTYVNGYMANRFNSAETATPAYPVSFFRLDGLQPVTLGAIDGSDGVTGWVDDFKVLFGAPLAAFLDFETVCNHANGTLMGVDENSLGEWKQVANVSAYSAGHTRINDQLYYNRSQGFSKKMYSQYACYHDYRKDYAATPNNVPHQLNGESYSIRTSIHMPEGPLYHDAPRPYSANNNFCLGCHNTNGAHGLGLAALAQGTVPAKNDPRRQPTQSLPYLTGNVPSGWNGFSGSAQSMASGDFKYLDELVMSSISDDSDGDHLTNTQELVGIEENGFVKTDPQSSDTDNDGLADNVDPYPLVAAAVTPLTDTDNDGTPDILDLFDSDPTEWADADGDGVGNNADTDDDNDGATDALDAFPDDASESVDTDGDGVGNNSDDDDDNDSVVDSADNCATLGGQAQLDTDGDGMGDGCDSDDDNDGWSDNEEADYTAGAYDYNGGLGSKDPTHPPSSFKGDTDEDGIPDRFDNCPNWPRGSALVTPANPHGWDTNQDDFDKDGIGDICDIDVDGDYVLDFDFALEPAPAGRGDSARYANDRDVCIHVPDLSWNGNADRDIYQTPCDAFPNNSAAHLDTDGDGMPDALHTRKDFRYVAEYALPVVGLSNPYTYELPYASGGCNGDPVCTEAGSGLTVDTDDDNDEILDDLDNCPTVANGPNQVNSNQIDTDHDGKGDVCDSDDDGDGLQDYLEQPIGTPECRSLCTGSDPLSADSDGDGVDDLEDIYVGLAPKGDADQDGLSNEFELQANSNPFASDSDGSGSNDGLKDFDHDGLNNLQEQANGTDPRDEDTDNDTLSDSAEVEAGRNPLQADYQVSSGMYHTCSLDDDGIKCWGAGTSETINEVDNQMGQSRVPTSLVHPLAVSAGGWHTCAIDKPGTTNTVVCWGRDTEQQSSGMPTLVNPVQISAGAYHTCVLDQLSVGNNEVKCWGYAYEGVTAVPSLSHPRQISSHGWHSCAIDDNGMKCWGRHAEEQAPDRTATPPQPYLYSDVVNPKLAVTGYFHTCAITAAAPEVNNMQCWGDDRGAQSTVPVLENPQVAEGGFLHTCAIERETTGELKGQQSVLCWTSNDAFGVIPVPTMVQPVQITSGWRHSCALDTSGVHCWGAGKIGEVDDPHYGQSIVPTLTFDADNDGVANAEDAFPLDASESIDTDKDGIGDNADPDNDNDGYTDVREGVDGTDPLRVNYQVATGDWHTCAIDEIGLKCWGDNRNGQLGVDSNIDGYVDGLVHPRQVSAGPGFTCVLDDKGVHCWGSNEVGQTNVPLLVHPQMISAGMSRACAVEQLNSSGQSRVTCWGDSPAVPTLVNPLTVSAHGHHTCAIDLTGVVCWGRDDYGQAVVPTLTETVTSLGSGQFHSCAIAGGDVTCWGADFNGQVSLPSGTAFNNAQEMSGGALHTCVLDKAIGGATSVHCFAANPYYNVATDPVIAQLVNPSQVAVGLWYACAMDDKGLHCWGSGKESPVPADGNEFGQSIVPPLFFDHDLDSVSSDVDDLPHDPSESVDTDHDGVGNNADTDDDNDGVADVSDEFPLDAAEFADNDSDGVGNNADTDDDNDGVSDDADNCPLSVGLGTDQTNTDGDAQGNLCDTDDDNDTLPDTWESSHGRDPLHADYQLAGGARHNCVLDDAGVECWGRNVEGQAPALVSGLFHPRELSVGVWHSCAVDDTDNDDIGDTVKCWGSHAWGQSGGSDTDTGTTSVSGLVGAVKQVSAGEMHSCALDSEGVKCWGNNDDGAVTSSPATSGYLFTATAVPDLVTPKQISVGKDFSCALDSQGVKCWGTGYTSVELITTAGLVNPTGISAGMDHVCATDSGDIKCWGSDSNGQISNKPSTFASLSQVSAGGFHTCALDSGDALCWGAGETNGTEPDFGQSIDQTALNGAVQIASSWYHSCVLDSEGVHCWGFGGFDSLNVPNLDIDADGDGLTVVDEALIGTDPLLADTDSDTVSDGDEDYDGDGLTNRFELYLGTDLTSVSTDASADPDGDTLSNLFEQNHNKDPLHADYQLAGGARHNCVLDDAGVECWGRNVEGQAPALVSGLSHPRELSVGVWHSCAVDDTDNDDIGDTVKCWGSHAWGQSGGSDTDTGTTSVSGLVGAVKQVSAGEMHSCALDSEGVKCWGNNDDGAVTSPATSGYLFTATAVPDLVTPKQISVGKDFSCALDSQGVKCWGTGYTSVELITTAGLVNPTGISAGMDHVCATDSGDIKCWGSDSNGQISNKPSTFASLSQVSAGGFHTCALDSGDALCWGAGETNGTEPDFGQSIDQTALNGAVQIASSWYHSCVLDSEGVHCWGFGGFGSLSVPNLDIDADGDGLTVVDDNCLWISNTDQADGDNDGYGNVCDAYPSNSSQH